MPVVLNPGKNEVVIGIDTLKNTNGSAPNLTDIRRWYFADAEGTGPTVYFGDVVLERTVAMTEAHGDPARLRRIRASVMPKINLKSNKLRPAGWTSADAAGLPIFPAVVRYDEIKRGMVEHAMRMGVRKTRRAYVYPATHYASSDSDLSLPRMGERLRLKKTFDISGFSPAAQAILKGLKKYGVFVADNGLEWTISVAPDARIPLLHEEFSRIKGSAFEVVERIPGQ